MEHAWAVGLLAGVVAVAVLAAGCGGSSPSDDVDCIDAASTGDRIAEGANETPITPVETQAVQSADSDVYYVAMTFEVDGEEQTGVWSTTDLDKGAIISVDALAKAVTDWPDAEQAFGITYPNDGTRAAESCLS